MAGKRILVIAGSDSSGGAGLEADQKVIAHHGCYAMTATTALTAQNTQGVRDVHVIPSDFVVQQIDAVFDDIGVDVVKIGMLASAETVERIAASLKQRGCQRLVLDPVMVATSGAQLLPENAIENLCTKLIPMAFLLTPNIPEAQLLLRHQGQQSHEINGLDDLVELAGRVHEMGSRNVLLKGGHLPMTTSLNASQDEATHRYIINIVHTGDKVMIIQCEYVRSKNTHGTGCSLASAIASQMALHPTADIGQQVLAACRYVQGAIVSSVDWKLGKGHGPINHFAKYSTDTKKQSVEMYEYSTPRENHSKKLNQARKECLG